MRQDCFYPACHTWLLFPQSRSVLPRSRMTCYTCVPLSDPARGSLLAIEHWFLRGFLLLPLSQQRRPPALLLLSRLYDAAFELAVCALQTLPPRPVQDWVPVVRRAFPDEEQRLPSGLMKGIR
jgi:hypothetical protein